MSCQMAWAKSMDRCAIGALKLIAATRGLLREAERDEACRQAAKEERATSLREVRLFVGEIHSLLKSFLIKSSQLPY